jgi:hypothetical protein
MALYVCFIPQALQARAIPAPDLLKSPVTKQLVAFAAKDLGVVRAALNAYSGLFAKRSV